ncbi:MAG: sensor domain-containing diguanylate cyclase [Elusimicrobia bacterium]|nr:sensor domain-containing diguanylate cyclase [Candidatus Liberimonas magnetica]
MMKKEFVYELLDNIDTGVYLVDKDRKIIFWNKGAQLITGYKSTEVLSQPCCDNILVHIDENGINQCGSTCPLFETIDTGVKYERELYLLHKTGYRVPVSVIVLPIRDEKGAITGAAEIFKDRSGKVDSIEEIDELKKLILFDPLTHSGNRRFVEMNLHTRFAELIRYNIPFGVLFVDIDDFKVINDKYGHDIGDKVLAMVSQTLSKNLRTFDILGRWGGDEFVAVIINVNEGQLSAIANKLRLLIEKSLLVISSEIITVTISAGASIAGKEDTNETLMKRADKLMYESKSKGKNSVTVG